mmetsp:Transcript_6375/g.15510  ORF Transcript_6375/g.15510 Transcript_6375/m.15510 type:complete len:204 (-) Transcript_6375:430-1041(-)
MLHFRMMRAWLPACLPAFYFLWRSVEGAGLLDVVGALAGLVLLGELLHDLPRVVELAQILGEHGVLLVVVQKGPPPHEPVVLVEALGEEVADAGVVREHQAAHPVLRLDVGRLLAQRDLDAGGPPLDEVGQLALPDPLQRLVHLSGVHLPLDHVQNRNVLGVGGLLAARVRGDHDVLRLQQAAHHVEHRRLADRRRNLGLLAN